MSNRYEVGYGKPPKHGQFKPGQSGNPEGRPRGALSMATIVQRILNERVSIQKNGKRKTITKLEVAVRQFLDKAALGDLKAFQLLTAVLRYAEEPPTQEDGSNLVTDEIHQRVVGDIVKRIQSAKGERNDGTSTD